jgi:hypothetical protein
MELQEDDELDELDEFDLLDDLDDGDLIAADFTDQATRVNLDTFTRRSCGKLKNTLREHPAVRNILDDWIHDRNDQGAVSALEALVKPWGITPLDGQKAASVSLEAVESYLGECAWSGCREPRKERQGSRGRHPKHCHGHTLEKKRKDDRERIKAKRAGVLVVPECCKDWNRSGHRGKCGQHRQHEAASGPQYPLTAIEAAYLSEGGLHLV